MTIRISKRIGWILLGILAALIFILLGVGIGSYPTPQDTPKVLQCPYPTEDSCKPEHLGNGKWILILQVP